MTCICTYSYGFVSQAWPPSCASIYSGRRAEAQKAQQHLRRPEGNEALAAEAESHGHGNLGKLGKFNHCCKSTHPAVGVVCVDSGCVHVSDHEAFDESNFRRLSCYLLDLLCLHFRDVFVHTDRVAYRRAPALTHRVLRFSKTLKCRVLPITARSLLAQTYVISGLGSEADKEQTTFASSQSYMK